jgi:hypothetical protein
MLEFSWLQLSVLSPPHYPTQLDVGITPLCLQWGEHVAVCGEGPAFGDWDVTK